MSRATEEWKERIRYEVDTGTFPRVRSSRLRRLGRFLLITGVVTAAIIAYGNHSGSGPAEMPSGDSRTQSPQTMLAVANPEPMKKRSFTPKGGVIADAGDAEAKVPRAEPAPPQTPQTPLAAPVEHASVSEPSTTGAIPELLRRPGEIARAPSVKPSASHEARPSRVVQRSADLPESKKPRRAARGSIAAEPAVEHTSLRAPAPSRAYRTAPQPIVARSPVERAVPARVPAERVVAIAPRKTTVCLYFVVCF
jgi:hypothetical protein